MWAAASMLPVTRPSRTPGVDQAVEQLLDPRHHPVAVRLGDRVGQVAQVAADRLRALLRRLPSRPITSRKTIAAISGSVIPASVCSAMFASTP